MADTIYGTGTYTGGTNGHDVIIGINPGHLDGGAGSDNINGSSGNDLIQGGQGTDFMYGGGGNDTFLFLAQDVTSEPGVYDRIFDFQGAGVASGDRLTFRGFGEGTTLDLQGSVAHSNGSVTYQYFIQDAADPSHSQTIFITSVNGLALTAGDYAFYGSVPVV